MVRKVYPPVLHTVQRLRQMIDHCAGAGAAGGGVFAFGHERTHSGTAPASTCVEAGGACSSSGACSTFARAAFEAEAERRRRRRSTGDEAEAEGEALNRAVDEAEAEFEAEVLSRAVEEAEAEIEACM